MVAPVLPTGRVITHRVGHVELSSMRRKKFLAARHGSTPLRSVRSDAKVRQDLLELHQDVPLLEGPSPRVFLPGGSGLPAPPPGPTGSQDGPAMVPDPEDRHLLARDERDEGPFRKGGCRVGACRGQGRIPAGLHRVGRPNAPGDLQGKRAGLHAPGRGS